MSRSARRCMLALLVCSALPAFGAARPAYAFDPIKPVCSAAGFFSGLLGKACSAVQSSGRLMSAGKQLITGHVGGAVKAALGEGGRTVASTATTAIGLAAVGAWVIGGARFALHATSRVLDETTTPRLGTTWFSSTYWRVAGIATLLTLPFLFAAAVQALLQTDLALLLRAALGHLPLAMLAISIAAPVTMLLLSASDQLSAIVSGAAGGGGAGFISRTAGVVGSLAAISHSPFIAFFIGLLTVAGAIALWGELLVREAAVYVIVLMLPLTFAALVWPARRVWAVRAVELLAALILSKFAIVAVLSLGGAALSETFLRSATGMIAGFALLVMAAFTPWALLRLVPIGEIASSAAGPLRGELIARRGSLEQADGGARSSHDWGTTTAEMRRGAEQAAPMGRNGAGAEAAADHPSARESAASHPLDGPSSALAGTVAVEPEPGIGSGAPASAGEPAAAAPSGPTAADRRAERLPGLDPRWQKGDYEWPVTVLGLDDHGTAPAVGARAAAASSDAPGADAALPDEGDPTPPPQPPADGRL